MPPSRSLLRAVQRRTTPRRAKANSLIRRATASRVTDLRPICTPSYSVQAKLRHRPRQHRPGRGNRRQKLRQLTNRNLRLQLSRGSLNHRGLARRSLQPSRTFPSPTESQLMGRRPISSPSCLDRGVATANNSGLAADGGSGFFGGYNKWPVLQLYRISSAPNKLSSSKIIRWRFRSGGAFKRGKIP